MLRWKRVEGEVEGEVGVYARKSGGRETGGASTRLAMEQLVVLCDRRGAVEDGCDLKKGGKDED